MRYTTKQTISHKGKFYTGEIPEEVVNALGAQVDKMVKSGSLTVILDEVDNADAVIADAEAENDNTVEDKPKAPRAAPSKNNFKELRDQVIAHAKANGLAEEDYKDYLKSKDSCMQYLNGV
jgi:pyruvate/2-oxoglutarate dehydrogenase complex dihydrolipoamide acyltransferase (E2) component